MLLDIVIKQLQAEPFFERSEFRVRTEEGTLEFTFNADGNIKGFFLSIDSISTPGNTGGQLISAVEFPEALVATDGGILKFNYDLGWSRESTQDPEDGVLEVAC